MSATGFDRASKVSMRLKKVMEGGDSEQLQALFAPGAWIWHSFDEVRMTPTDVAASLAQFRQGYRDITIDEIRLHPLETGFVQTYALRATHRDTGKAIKLPTCIFVRLDGEQIAAVEEYVDPTPLKIAG